jgi:transketolase
MHHNTNIYFVTADLGFKLWDAIERDFPDRFIKLGASEQLMMGICSGLAMSNKIAIAYSITPFLLARPYEWIRNYVNHENLNVKLVGAGRDKDYDHDGFTHWADDDENLLKSFEKIAIYKPNNEHELSVMIETILSNTGPAYLNLRRKI